MADQMDIDLPAPAPQQTKKKRNHLMEPCIDCGNNPNFGANSRTATHTKCPRAVGVCNHSFHLHCIDTWIQKRNSCPLDNSDWSIKDILKD
ncbi:hypothetical protein KL929_005066 [Ogataea haglerorum]|nr:hypothetical protein KL929_005066 [Ogataea haglerorum]